MDEKTPVFIKIEKYNHLLDVMSQIRDKIERAKSHLQQIEEVKQKEEAELDEWRRGVTEMEEKVNEIGNIFLKPEVAE